MVTFAQCSTGDRMVRFLDGTVAMIQNIHTPSRACDLLSVFGESPTQMSLVEVTQADNKTVRVVTLRPRQLFCQCVYCCCDVSIRWNVNTREDKRIELTGRIE